MRTLQDYKNGPFKRQIEELQLKQMPYKYRDVFLSKKFGATTPLFTAETPGERSCHDLTGLDDSSPERPQKTYITQMGQVDLERGKTAPFAGPTPPGTRSDQTLPKFQSPMLAREQERIRRPQRPKAVHYRMVPKEKKELTSVLHEYIQAHKLKKVPRAVGGEISLVTGQGARIEAEYAAISMYPTEKVSKLLKERDEVRWRARQADQLQGSQGDLLIGRRGIHFGKGLLEYEMREKRVMRSFKTLASLKRLETGQTDHSNKQIRLKQKQLQLAQAEIYPQVEDAEILEAVERQENEGAELSVDEEEARSKHFASIRQEVEQEPELVYAKNNLVLEKIILDRALEKVQKRRFVKQSLSSNINYSHVMGF